MNHKIVDERYEIIRKIGSGGMADVYLAKDLVLNRDVALKVLRDNLINDPVSLLRFQREAHAGSGLNHPNIVEIYDVGSEEGLQYIVMEYVEGVTAKELVLRRGGLEINEAVDFMQQLVSGIAKAHTSGIVHRDIKPQNILVKGDGSLKVSDFGIAQSGDAIQLTKTDSVMGSIHYLAPEVVRGEGASISSDIYAMGIIFYEILTGKMPFDGDMPVEIAMMHLRDNIPSVQEVNPKIPNSIVNIINKATAKNQQQRYRSAEAMLQDLKTCLLPERKNELLWIPSFEDDENTTKMIDSLNGIDESDEVIEPKKKRKWWILGGVIGFVLLVGIVYVLLPKTKTVELEDLSGMSIEEAELLLEDYNITIAKRNLTYDFSDEIEENKIIETSPEAGSEVEYGSQIKVVLSNGPLFEISDYKGQSIDDVRNLLTDKTKLYVRVKHQPSKDYAPGTILGQELLAPGEKINPKQSQEIVLIVASEVEEEIPNLIGIPIDQARILMEDKGIKVVLKKLPLSGFSNSQLELLEYDVVKYTNPIAGSKYIQTESNEFVIEYYASEDKPEIEVEDDND